jgi:methionyl-tRNA formyltransferase
MSDKKLKVFFLGSGSIAVPSLDVLAKSDLVELIGVGTQQDKKAGRGNRMTPTPVGRTAEELGLNPWKVLNINESETVNKLQELKTDIILVIAFGQLLKEAIINLPRIGCINVHASILPFYRGASPIASAILNGEKESGVSIMEIEKGLDSGPVFEIFKTPIESTDNSNSLETKLANLSADNIINSLIKIGDGATKTLQNHDNSTHCSKIVKTDAHLDWSESASSLKNKIHAFFPWPGAYFFIETSKGAKRITTVSAGKCSEKTEELPGTLLDGEKKRWLMACGNNEILEIFTVKPEGKKIMSASDFLRGSQMKPGTNLILNKVS